MLEIFNVRANTEFSELLHLCLFAFDKVCDFYRDQMFDESLIQPILSLLLQLIDILNSIPEPTQQTSSAPPPSSNSRDPATSSSSTLTSRYKCPFSLTLLRNTLHVQRTLRRALFRHHFMEEDEESVHAQPA